MIQAWLQFKFKFKGICRNYQLLMDCSMLGDDWMSMDIQLLNNRIEKV
jgi:hypothetical protein